MDEMHNRGSPRLRFSEEELADPALARPIARAEKAADQLEKARKKLRSRYRLKLSSEEASRDERSVPAEESTDASPEISGDEHADLMTDTASTAGSAGGRQKPAQSSMLRESSRRRLMETEPEGGIADGIRTDPSAPAVKNTRQRKYAEKVREAHGLSGRADAKPGLRQEVSGAPSGASEASVSPGSAIAPGSAKKKTVRLRFEEAQPKKPSRLTHSVEKTVRSAGDQLHRQAARSNEDGNVAVEAALKGDQAAGSALQTGENAIHARRLHKYKTVRKAEQKLDKANIRVLEAKRSRENPQFTSNPYSRWQQKREIRKQYAEARRSGGRITFRRAGNKAEKAVDKLREAAVNAVRKRPSFWIILGLGGLLLVFFSMLQSCAPMVQSVGGATVVGTYPAEEADVRAAERAYATMESELKHELEHYEQVHPGYDEYHVDKDEIWHDPYVLMAIISACRDGEEWNMDTAAPIIDKYFRLQYIVTETVTTETRYRTETRTGTRTVTDPDTGAPRTETYTYEVQVPYTYTICNVTMENKDLSHLPVVSMSHDGMSLYAMYMSTHGNMDGLFHGAHASELREPTMYDIPQSVLDADPDFARLMAEATKYVGYPYVWGGSDPDTSFDCSGFVSYVFTASGVYNTGRLGAKGLRSLCRNVPADQVRPGDIVFFDGTMGEDVEGITHCGIYVGNGWMIHCGSPIGFANLNDSYWRKHFHSYGRVPK